MNPSQQPRVVGPIGPAVGRRSLHSGVDALYALDQRERVVPVAVGRTRDECRGSAQPAEHVGAKSRVIPHAGERERMERLQHQRADAADHHGWEIRMNLPARGVRTEKPRVAWRRGVIERRPAAARGQMRHGVYDLRAQMAGERASDAGALRGRIAGMV